MTLNNLFIVVAILVVGLAAIGIIWGAMIHIQNSNQSKEEEDE